MLRVGLFLTFLVGLGQLMNLNRFQSFAPSLDPFNFEAVAALHSARQAVGEIVELSEDEAAAPETAPKGILAGVEMTPELERGAKLYKRCILCHGPRGRGKRSQKAPAIGGQYDWYVESVILAMQNGERINKLMNPYIKRLSAQDVADLAAYISKLPPMGL